MSLTVISYDPTMKVTTMNKYCYSFDEEHYNEPECDATCLVCVLLEANERAKDQKFTAFYIGEQIVKKHSDFINLDRVLEDMVDYVTDDLGCEFGSLMCDHINNTPMTDQFRKEFDTVINTLFDDRFGPVTFWGVKNVEDYDVE